MFKVKSSLIWILLKLQLVNYVVANNSISRPETVPGINGPKKYKKYGFEDKFIGQNDYETIQLRRRPNETIPYLSDVIHNITEQVQLRIHGHKSSRFKPEANIAALNRTLQHMYGANGSFPIDSPLHGFKRLNKYHDIKVPNYPPFISYEVIQRNTSAKNSGRKKYKEFNVCQLCFNGVHRVFLFWFGWAKSCVYMETTQCMYHAKTTLMVDNYEATNYDHFSIVCSIERLMAKNLYYIVDAMTSDDKPEEHKKDACLANLSIHTDCTRDNICTGCELCECNSVLRWECRWIQRCWPTVPDVEYHPENQNVTWNVVHHLQLEAAKVRGIYRRVLTDDKNNKEGEYCTSMENTTNSEGLNTLMPNISLAQLKSPMSWKNEISNGKLSKWKDVKQQHTLPFSDHYNVKYTGNPNKLPPKLPDTNGKHGNTNLFEEILLFATPSNMEYFFQELIGNKSNYESQNIFSNVKTNWTKSTYKSDEKTSRISQDNNINSSERSPKERVLKKLRSLIKSKQFELSDLVTIKNYAIEFITLYKGRVLNRNVSKEETVFHQDNLSHLKTEKEISKYKLVKKLKEDILAVLKSIGDIKKETKTRNLTDDVLELVRALDAFQNSSMGNEINHFNTRRKSQWGYMELYYWAYSNLQFLLDFMISIAEDGWFWYNRWYSCHSTLSEDRIVKRLMLKFYKPPKPKIDFNILLRTFHRHLVSVRDAYILILEARNHTKAPGFESLEHLHNIKLKHLLLVDGIRVLNETRDAFISHKNETRRMDPAKINFGSDIVTTIHKKVVSLYEYLKKLAHSRKSTKTTELGKNNDKKSLLYSIKDRIKGNIEWMRKKLSITNKNKTDIPLKISKQGEKPKRTIKQVLQNLFMKVHRTKN